MEHFCNDVLGVQMPGRCEMAAYADDFSLVTADLEMESLKSKVKVADGWTEVG